MVKNRFFAFLIVFILILVPIGAKANNERIKSIEIEVILEDDGTAKVKQVWDVSTHSGTEFYIPITHLNHMKLENFRVSDENGKEFEFVNTWDINGSLEDKAFKNGINKTGDGIELCWGKGSFGSHKYTISWDYKNAVQSFTDYDGFNIRFVNDKMNPLPESVKISISKPNTILNKDNTRIWGFGYKGDLLFVEDGIVKGKTNRALKTNEYMNIMMSFKKGIFNPDYATNKSFDTLKDQALRGAKPYEQYSIVSLIMRNLSFIAGAILSLAVIMWILVRARIFSKDEVRGKLYFEKDGKKIYLMPKNRLKKPKKDEVEYYRELPDGNNLDMMFYIRSLYEKKNIWSDLVSAYLLKWIKSENIKYELKQTVDILTGEEDIKVRFTIYKTPEFSKKAEADLWDLINSAAGSDAVLSEREFEKFAKSNYWKIQELERAFSKCGGIKFLELGGLEVLDSNRKSLNTNLTILGERYIRNYFGLKKFFTDFPKQFEKDIKDIKSLDEHLLVATLMGVGENLLNKMDSTDISYLLEREGGQFKFRAFHYTNRNLYDSVIGFSEHGNKGYNAAMAAISSGGGGSSFSGGGGGFSGGGSGGGSR